MRQSQPSEAQFNERLPRFARNDQSEIASFARMTLAGVLRF